MNPNELNYFPVPITGGVCLSDKAALALQSDLTHLYQTMATDQNMEMEINSWELNVALKWTSDGHFQSFLSY